MTTGQILTTVTIWISIVAYAAGSLIFKLSTKRSNLDAAARLIWTVACAALIAHVVCAFQTYHSWSHRTAYLDTARQTREVTGLDWGGGLYVNYLLLIGWFADVVWWWAGGLGSYRRRPWLLTATWHALLIFIIFNSTVIFETRVTRWIGLLVCLGLCVVWWHIARDLRTGLRGPSVREGPRGSER